MCIKHHEIKETSLNTCGKVLYRIERTQKRAKKKIEWVSRDIQRQSTNEGSLLFERLKSNALKVVIHPDETVLFPVLRLCNLKQVKTLFRQVNPL